MVRQTSDCPAILGDRPSARSSRRIGTAKISRIDGNGRTSEDDATLIEWRDRPATIRKSAPAELAIRQNSWHGKQMSGARVELLEIYREMSDEELIERWVSDNLTEIAKSVAWTEFTKRGIQPPYVVTNADVDDSAAKEETVTFVTVARSLIPSKLYVLHARLEGDGIPSYVVDNNLTQMNPLWAIAVGGARLLVHQDHAIDAIQIIRLLNSGKFALQDDDGET